MSYLRLRRRDDLGTCYALSFSINGTNFMNKIEPMMRYRSNERGIKTPSSSIYCIRKNKGTILSR
jgi:hypothetical protein